MSITNKAPKTKDALWCEGVAGVFSLGIYNSPNIKVLLGADELRFRPARRDAPDLSFIVGWGNKRSAIKARAYASNNDLPFVALEDGFIRSMGLSGQWAQQLSLVIDDKGIYYDARKESRLELLIKKVVLNQEALLRARQLRSRILKLKISKYNHQPDAPLLPSGEKVLVVDQTLGDQSILDGLATDGVFSTMLAEAVRLHPEATIYLKMHPEVVSGKKTGHFDIAQLPSNVVPISESMNPIGLIEQMDHVHVVTSQLGFEALMLGKSVTCHGMPFYAGWGLTEDRVSCDRRAIPRTIDELFYATYIQYSHYINPVSTAVCELEEMLDYMDVQLDYMRRNVGRHYCLGFRYWKRYIVRGFLQSPNNEIIFCANLKSALRKGLASGDKIVIWANKETHEIRDFSESMSISLLRVEDGFLRSAGLGSDFVTPLSLVFDDQGIYYNPVSNSRVATILNESNFSEDLLERARNLRSAIVRTGTSKYNLKGCAALEIDAPATRRKIFVPGQVEDDASVVHGGGVVQSNCELLAKVRKNNPEAYILFKPHPDVVAGNRKVKSSIEHLHQYCDAYVSDVAITDCLKWADEVHTLTSLTGFEALLRNIPVTTYGKPFYSGWGLTTDMTASRTGRKKVGIEEMVAAVLMIYPRYYDWKSRSFITVEQAQELLSVAPSLKRKSIFYSLPVIRHGIIKVRQLLNMVKYA